MLQCSYCPLQVDPIKGNVAFGACQSGWSFTLQSFAQLYCDVYGAALDPKEFARRLWGDIYFQPTTRKFKKSPPERDSQRTFVHYILTPLYKIYSQVGVLGRAAHVSRIWTSASFCFGQTHSLCSEISCIVACNHMNEHCTHATIPERMR